MQRTFDDLGTPLHEVTFCVLDIETTGGSAADGGITEVGVVKLQGGVCLGTFQTMVNPGCAIPPQITVLTGITHSMVLRAPRIETVLPSLLEFVRGAVIVGHNVRYDLGFLNAALERSGRPRFANRSVDTCALARRLVRDEVPNCKLGTLASRFRLPHRPTHRALDDALATGDLLHVLLERAGGLGVTGLDDLLALPKIAGHPQVHKLQLTDHLPRKPGVYLFRDPSGRVLYVGKATDLRARVRSYFSGEERRKVGQLLREVASIDHVVCSGPLEAAVLEVRLIHRFEPRFNRQAKMWRAYAYLKLTNERYPRLSVVKAVRPDGGLYLGPLPSQRSARRVAEAIETVVPLRRCTAKPGAALRDAPCTPAQLGVATCPCAGSIGPEEYGHLVDHLRTALTTRPDLLLAPLRARMERLASAERFEEAADVRDRAAALAGALRRQRRFDTLRLAGRVVVEIPGRGGAELSHGRLVRAWGRDGQADLGLGASVAGEAPGGTASPGDPSPPDLTLPPCRSAADELSCIASWLDREGSRVRVVHAEHGIRSILPGLPTFSPSDTVGRPSTGGSRAAREPSSLA